MMRFDSAASAADTIRRLVVGGLALCLLTTALAAIAGDDLRWDDTPFLVAMNLLRALGALMVAVGVIGWGVSLGIRAAGLTRSATAEREGSRIRPLDPLN